METAEGEGLFISKQDVDVLEAYQIIAEGNTEIARENAAALLMMERAYNELLWAGKGQQRLTEIQTELLEAERRAHFWDLWFYRALLGLGIVGVAL